MTLPKEITRFVDLLRDKCPKLSVDIDAPRDPKGEWWIDLSEESFQTHVSWKPAQGFGVFTSEEAGFGERPDEIYVHATDACDRICQLKSSWQKARRIRPMKLG